MQSNLQLFTIGHSTHTLERFLKLLKTHEVTALADVRTSPFSRHFSHFNKETLKAALHEAGIAYVFLGKELGGRPESANCYHQGVADYEKMALQHSFKEGLERVVDGGKKHRIALMCSEQNPLDCHRCLLVGRALSEHGIKVQHILANGSILSHQDIENQLLEMANKSLDDLFASPEERLNIAYRARAMKVAFSEVPPPEKHMA